MNFLAFGPDFAGVDAMLRCGIVGSVAAAHLERAQRATQG